MIDVFREKNCSPAVYALTAVSKFGLQCLDWDPLVVRDAFQLILGYKMKNKAFDKLQAGLTMIGTDAFLSTIQGFAFCTAVCNNKPMDKDIMPYVTLKQICWAVYLYKELIGLSQVQQEASQNISSDVVLYIQEAMKVAGVARLPEYMAFIPVMTKQASNINIQDATVFEAYKVRQQNTLIQIERYVADRQEQLIQQLKALQKQGYLKAEKGQEIS